MRILFVVVGALNLLFVVANAVLAPSAAPDLVWLNLLAIAVGGFSTGWLLACAWNWGD